MTASVLEGLPSDWNLFFPSDGATLEFAEEPDEKDTSQSKAKPKDPNRCECGSLLISVPTFDLRRHRDPSDDGDDMCKSGRSVWIKVCARSLRTKRNCKYALAKKPIPWCTRSSTTEAQDPNPIPPVVRAEEAIQKMDNTDDNKKNRCPRGRRRARLCPRR